MGMGIGIGIGDWGEITSPQVNYHGVTA